MNMPISLSTPFTPDGKSDPPADQSGTPEGADFSAFFVIPAALPQPPAAPSEQITNARPAEPSIAQPWPQPLQSPAADSGSEPLWAGFDHASVKPVIDGPIKPEFDTATSKPGGRGTEIFHNGNPADTTDPQLTNPQSPFEPMATTRSKSFGEVTSGTGVNTIVPGPQASTAALPTELPSIPSTEQWAKEIQDPRPVSRSKNTSGDFPVGELPQPSSAAQISPSGKDQVLGTNVEYIRPGLPNLTEIHAEHVRHTALSGTGSTEHLPGSKPDRDMARFSLPRLSSILGEAAGLSSTSLELNDSAADVTQQAFSNPDDASLRDLLQPAKLTVSESFATGPQSQVFAESVQIASDTAQTVEQDRLAPHIPAGVDVLEQIEPRMLDIVRDLLPGEDANSLKMRLSPAELGSVEITIVRHASGAMSAEFWTENETAQSALNENLAQLRESLEASGVQIESIEIGCRSFSSDAQQGRQSPEVRAEQYSSGTAAPAASPDEEPGGEDRLVDLRA